MLPPLLAGAVAGGVQAPPAADMRTLTYASRDGAELRSADRIVPVRADK